MSFEPELEIGQVVNNDQLINIFKCSPQGGMRKSNSTNTLVIIANHTGDNVYSDRREGNIYFYTGMGQIGDQSLSFSQNKTLAESRTNNVKVYLFEVFKSQQYTYMGEVILAGSPVQEEQIGKDGNPRKVWVFPLNVKSYDDPRTFVESEVIEDEYQRVAKNISRLSDDDVEANAKRAENKQTKNSRKTSSVTYIRNVWVSEYAKRRANGNCQLCMSEAPFRNRDGKPYLETHHIKWLSDGGSDTIKNNVALCPNCHKKMHVLNNENDIKKLSDIVNSD